jgi:signal transduction histidine kinase
VPHRRLNLIPSTQLTSLRNRLALLFFAITLLSFAALYLYVAPGLRTRLLNERVHDLAVDARRYSGPIAATVGGAVDQSELVQRVDHAVLQSGARVTLLSVSEAIDPPGPQLATLYDSSPKGSAIALAMLAARQAVRTRQLATATERSASGTVAEAALPVRFDGQVVRVVVFSEPVADVEGSVAIVRHQIVIAGVIALMLALIGGYLTARWLAARVKRLERAAERVAHGEFGRPIRVDSRDELGQLAATFNEMQDQLAALESARKRFIATASHELRTPIFSLGGFVELLEDDDLDPATRRRFLGHVAEQVERLRKLSVDLLDLSRLESGSLELRPEHVDLGELTRSVAAEFELALAERDALLELHLEGGRDLIQALCDPVRVAQIVRILIDNALTHTATGTRIVVTAGRQNGNVRLAVDDNGAGIDPVALPRVFEPFFTADDTQGSGLGLAIASELAERMEGRLTVASAPGRTVFELQIPS